MNLRFESNLIYNPRKAGSQHTASEKVCAETLDSDDGCTVTRENQSTSETW